MNKETDICFVRMSVSCLVFVFRAVNNPQEYPASLRTAKRLLIICIQTIQLGEQNCSEGGFTPLLFRQQTKTLFRQAWNAMREVSE